MKPIVDGLERKFNGQLHVIRINVQDPVGQALTKLHHFQYTPTFIFFDAEGVEQWRVIGGLDPNLIRNSLSL